MRRSGPGVLGDPIPPPAGWSSACGEGINNSGQVGGWGFNAVGSSQAFIGTAAGSVAIPPPTGWIGASGYGINDSGQVVGWGDSPSVDRQSFIGTVTGSTPVPLPAGWSSATAYSINDGGQIAGTGVNAAGQSQAFIGTAVGSVAVPLPEGWPVADEGGMNNSGQVTGDVLGSGPARAFIGTASGSVVIPLPDGWVGSSGSAINDSGQVAGLAYATGAQQAFVGTATGSTAIPLPPGWSSVWSTTSINNSGQVVGTGSGGVWIWDAANGSRDLNTLVPAGWTIARYCFEDEYDSISINDVGQIVAYGSDSGTGFVGTVVLTPGGSLLSVVNPFANYVASNLAPQVVDPQSVSTAPPATSLAADGESAVVLVYQSSSAQPVTFSISASTGTAIGAPAAFDPAYLVTPNPPAGSPQTLPSVTPTNEAGGSCNGMCTFLALLWSPHTIPFTPGSFPLITLTVTATQPGMSNPTHNAVSLVPPPLLLIHGVWSNAASAGFSSISAGFYRWVSGQYPHSQIYPVRLWEPELASL